MPPSVILSEKLVDRLKQIKSNCIGALFGIFFENSVLILGISFEDNNEINGGKENLFGTSQPHYPAEVDYCGIASFQTNSSKENEQLEGALKLVEEVLVTDTPFVSIVNIDTMDIKMFCYKNRILETVDFKTMSEKEIQNQFITVRVQSKLFLTCKNKIESIRDEIANLQKQITPGNLMFHFPDQNVYLIDQNCDSNLTQDSSIMDLISVQGKDKSIVNSKKKGKSNSSSNQGLLTAKLFLRSTKSEQKNDNDNPPSVNQIKHDTETLKIWLGVDALSMVHHKKKIQHLSDILVDSICRSLTLMEQALEKNATCAPVLYHFSVSQLSHFFTIAYPESALEDTLKNYRESIHTLLNLPTNQPFFRKGNAHHFVKKDLPFSSILINPHEGLSSSGVNKGEVALINGKYSYHHYMQDDINDNGWGCAYRSLQTIVSWFRLQGFTNHPIPSHEEIQKCLVDIGDKPRSFIGSRQWIGSTEISYCLESMLGVTSRIIAINSGEELSERGSELLYHFKTQGTPIMIGGGVLAHTIIGVHFNNQTGSIKLLIVDPHYIGSEDLKTIQEKGWVGWKPLSFWQKNTFYNLCLPLKPSCV